MKRKMYWTCGGLLLVLGWAESSFAMGRIPKKDYQAKVAELEQSKKECASATESFQAKVTTLESQNATLLNDMESSKSDLQKKLAELIKEKQQVEKEKADEVQKVKSTYDQLMGDMKKEIDQGSVQITQLKDKLSMNLVDKILFDSGAAEVNEQGKRVLKKVAEILKKIKDKQIRIEGHTDNIPIGGVLKEKFPSNWELSTARATNVTRYLQEVGGIDPKIIFVAGFSEHRPIADNASLEGRSKNRRIEIALVPLESVAATISSIPPPAKK